MTEPRATRWEPSEVAEQLKKEYARAKRRKNRWGGKIEAPAPAPAQEDPTIALQAKVDEMNRLIGRAECTPVEKEALSAARNDLVKQLVAAKFGGGPPGVAPARNHALKVMLPDNTCPGGALNRWNCLIPRGLRRAA